VTVGWGYPRRTPPPIPSSSHLDGLEVLADLPRHGSATFRSDSPLVADPIAPMDDLDSIFTLPEDEDLTDDLRTMYEVIIARLRREANHLPMSTIQTLLLERIARNYIVLRLKESRAPGQGGFAHATAQKEFNTFWLSMTVEFNRLLRASDAGGYEQTMREFASILTETLNEVLGDQPVLAQRVRDRLAEQLDSRGV
jgi:hypothetical protein